MLQFGVSLTYNTSSVNYNRNMFIIQATGQIDFYNQNIPNRNEPECLSLPSLMFEDKTALRYTWNSSVRVSIVSRFPNETTCFSLQTFIVRFLIIGNTQKPHIYTQTERRGNRLGAGETERVCERQSLAENRAWRPL